MPTKRTYHIHKPNPSGQPRKIHPRQWVHAPTIAELEPHAADYCARAIDHARQALKTAPGATQADYPLPNRAQEAPALVGLLLRHLPACGLWPSALRRRRGTREPYVTLTWQPGWQPPAAPSLADPDSPTSSEPDERQK